MPLATSKYATCHQQVWILLVMMLFTHRLEASNEWNGGSKGGDARNDSPSPHHIAETPCGKGFRHGESLSKGLPNGLPNGLPIRVDSGAWRTPFALQRLIRDALMIWKSDRTVQPLKTGIWGDVWGDVWGVLQAWSPHADFLCTEGFSCDYGGTVAIFIQNVNHPGKVTSGRRR